MNDEDKTKQQLKLELARLRQRIAELEGQETERKHAEEEIIHLASFPELNPSTVLELDQEGNLIYLNPATKNILQNLATLGVNHPFLADWTQVVKELQSSNWVKTVMRNVVVESLVYEQVLYPVAENQIRIYGRNITDRKEAEEKLRESQKRYQSLVEATNDFVWEMNINGVYTYCSPQTEKLWGLKPEEMMGKTPFDFLQPEDREQANKVFSALSESSSPFTNMEMRSFDGTGRIRFMEISGVPFFYIAGKHCGYRGIARDITERKLAEEALKASQHFNQSLLNSTPNLIYVYDLVKHRNEFANREVSDFLGYTAEEVQAMGSSLFAILLHPDDAAMVAEHHARCAAASDEDVLEIVYRMRNSSGQWRWLRSKDVAFRRDDKGAITQILGSTEDITERKRLEEVLRQSERKFKAIALNCPDHILIQDKDLRYIFVLNPQLGLTEEDMIGKTDKDFLYEADAAQLTQTKEKVLRT